MPRLSCWFIRAALLHLATGAVVGGLILAAKGYPGRLDWAWLLLPAHIQLLAGGWLLQLTLGMGYWILPRLDAWGERGHASLAWVSFWTLNTGVIGAAVLLLTRSFRSAVDVNVLLIVAALLQACATIAFVGHAWRRVRPTVQLPRVQQHHAD